MDINLDFSYFPTGNTKTLGLIDASHYHTSTIANPKVFIILPGTTTMSEVVFKPNRINIYNSNNLCLTSVTETQYLIDLPDGIYTVKYTGNIGLENFEIEKNFLRTEVLQQKFESAVMKVYQSQCEFPDKNLDKLKEVEFSIYAAIAFANNCEISKAINCYRLADKSLDKLLMSC